MEHVNTFSMRDHLTKRGVPLDFKNYSEDEATFYLYTPTGLFAGVQYYRPFSDKKKRNDQFGKYMTKPVPGRIPVFGFDKLDYSKDYCFVQEGVFDALPLLNLGYNAVAVLTYSNKQAMQQLRLLFKNLYSLTDPDASGDKMGRLVDRHMTCPNGDVGDLWEASRTAELVYLAERLVHGSERFVHVDGVEQLKR